MICPNCKSEQNVSESQYGALYTCPSCQAVYFVNFSGEPEYSDQQEQNLTDFQNMQNIAPEPELTPISTDLDQLDQTLQSALDDVMSMPKIPMPTAHDDLAEAPQDNSPSEMAPFTSDISENLNDNVFVQPVQAAPVSPAAVKSSKKRQEKNETHPSTGFPLIAQEIADFGNTETQIAQLNYDLKISGLDTGEIRKLFIEAIQDSRFGWDAAEIVNSIRHGEVVLKQLNPAKAYVLAKRLQFIDLEQAWTQNAIS